MIVPEVNQENFRKALHSADAALENGKFDHVMLGVRQFGKDTFRNLNDASEIRERQLMVFSVTKAITGTAIARMVDQKILDWSDPICRYLPEMKDSGVLETIKIEDVFLHRTGLKAEGLEINNYKDLIKNALIYEPGSSCGYATITYQLINAVMRVIFGNLTMEEVLQKWIFEPCSMKSTSFVPVDFSTTIDCHFKDEAKLREFVTHEYSGSGLWSTMDDLLNFAEAVITPERLMSKGAFNTMTEAVPLLSTDKKYMVRTRGWNKELNFNYQPQRGFYHGGAAGTLIWCDPDFNLVVVFMANRYSGGNDDAFRAIGTFYV